MGWLKTRDSYNGLSQAASLGIALLKKTKKNTWRELYSAMEAGDPLVTKVFRDIELTDRQLALIAEHQPVLLLLQITPAATPAVCPKCGYFVLISDTAPTRCMVGAGCDGKPAKVAAATGSTVPPADLLASPDRESTVVPDDAGPVPVHDVDFDDDDPFG